MDSSQLAPSSTESYCSYGPQAAGAKLTINPTNVELPDLCTFDFETDGSKEQNFVGVAICPNLQTVWYFTSINETVRAILTKSKLIAHSIKSDLGFAHKAGITIPFENVFADTQLMSYCLDSTRKKYGLKTLAAEFFNAHWPTYEEMTENYKVSLAVQPVEKVANYCGRDALETLRLFYYLHRHMNTAQKRLHYQVELPETLILYLRERAGIKLDVQYLKDLQARITPELAHLEALLVNKGKEVGFSHKLKKGLVTELNPNAPAQLTSFLRLVGIDAPNAKAETLAEYEGNPVVDTYREFKKLASMRSKFVDMALALPSLPYVYTTFKQTDTITGRLASEEPNLQNIPAKGIYGDWARQAFVAREGMTFIDADYSNMELRVGAHFSQEPVWLEAFNDDRDIHQATADKIKKPRAIGKLFNLSAFYGIGAKKLSRTLKCSEGEAESELANYWRNLKRLHQWIEDTKRTAARRGGVTTLLGRFIGYHSLYSDNKWERFEAERQCVNAIIQGSSAELMKLSDIALFQEGVMPLICVHDEHLIEVQDSADETARVSEITKRVMEGVVTLRCPMKADLGVGKSWFAAKN